MVKHVEAIWLLEKEAATAQQLKETAARMGNAEMAALVNRRLVTLRSAVEVLMAYDSDYKTSRTPRVGLTELEIRQVMEANGFKPYPEVGDDLKPHCYKAIREILKLYNVKIAEREIAARHKADTKTE
jgi:hypothetical protein